MWPSRRTGINSIFECRPFYHRKTLSKEFALLPKRMTSGKLVWFKYYYQETLTYVIFYDEKHQKIDRESAPHVINRFTQQEYFLLKLQEKG